MKITDERVSKEIEFERVPRGAVFRLPGSDNVYQKVGLLCLDKLSGYAIHLQSGLLAGKDEMGNHPCILLDAELVIR